jgi:hypothetical protein
MNKREDVEIYDQSNPSTARLENLGHGLTLLATCCLSRLFTQTTLSLPFTVDQKVVGGSLSEPATSSDMEDK